VATDISGQRAVPGVTDSKRHCAIFLLDAVFSLDSVITAIGMVEQIEIMIAAVIVAVACMMFFAGPVANFVHRHPTIKMLALSFLLLIGLTLIVEAFDVHISKDTSISRWDFLYSWRCSICGYT